LNELLQPTPDYLIEQDNDRRRRGGVPNATLPAVEFVGFIPPLAGSCRFFAARIRNPRQQ
jgi:hypothetical protein